MLRGWSWLYFFAFWSALLTVSSSSLSLDRLRHRRRQALVVEKNIQKRGYRYVIGSDESGTGSIAGPIVTASCAIVQDLDTFTPIAGVDDCKILTREQRLVIYNHVLQNPQLYKWTYAIRSNEEIDCTSAQAAITDSFRESIERLALSLEAENTSIYSIIDGHRSPSLSMVSRPWKRGDGTVYTVALASILARSIRDTLMKQAALQYPAYNFDKNGGYPSKDHIAALHTHGPCPLHRKSCKPVNRRGVSRRNILAIATLGVLSSNLAHPTTSMAMTTDPKTGIALPDVGEIEAAIPKDWSESDNPIQEDPKSILSRLDSSPDSIFYQDPRFVEHVDSQAVQLLTEYISQVAIQPVTESVLDLCSSWTSHIQTKQRLRRVAGLGMNAKELEANPSLTEWIVRDLNDDPTLPYEDNAFDVVLCQLSIDYLTRPLEVCREIGRVLKKGGQVHIFFSNRLFLSKAVAIWTGADDIDHTFTVGAYLHFCGAPFVQIEAHDLSVRKGRDKRIVGDPLYVVTATVATE